MWRQIFFSLCWDCVTCLASAISGFRITLRKQGVSVFVFFPKGELFYRIEL